MMSDFEIFLWANMCPKMAAILEFWPYGGHKKIKKQNFQNHYFIFVERHTSKVHVCGVQMNVPLSNCDLKFTSP